MALSSVLESMVAAASRPESRIFVSMSYLASDVFLLASTLLRSSELPYILRYCSSTEHMTMTFASSERSSESKAEETVLAASSSNISPEVKK